MGLDREAELAIPLVDIVDAGVHTVTDRIPVGTLFAAFARQIGAADEARQRAGHRYFQAAICNGRDGAGDGVALVDAFDGTGERVFGQLFDAKADAFLLDVDVENARRHHLALVVVLHGFFAVHVPREVGQMHHAVDFAGETDKQTELGDVLDLAFDIAADRMRGRESVPRIVVALLETEAYPPFLGIGLQHHDVDFLTGRHDLAGMDVLFGPAHLRDMNQAFDARLQFDERTVIGDVADTAGKLGADRIFQLHAFPRIRIQLFHAERDTLGFGIVADDLDLDGLADRQGFGRMVDAAPRDIGDVQQPVDTAEIDERAVIGDVLDHAFEDLAFLEVGEQLVALFGPRFLENGAARNDDIAAAAIHFQNLERLRRTHQRTDIADRAHIDLAARQEGHGAGKIDGKPALDPAEDRAGDAFGFFERDFKLRPRFFAARALAAEDGFAVRVLHAFEIDIDDVADADFRILTRLAEFLQRHAAFGFEPDVDENVVAFDRQNGAFDDRAFGQLAVAEAFFEEGGEIFFGCCASSGCGVSSHV